MLKYDMKKENDRRHTIENSLHTISNIWMVLLLQSGTPLRCLK